MNFRNTRAVRPGFVRIANPKVKSKIRDRMSQFDSHKDYYEILGANERTSRRDLERL